MKHPKLKNNPKRYTVCDFLKYIKDLEKYIDYLEKPKLTKCYNCGEMVEMIPSGKFCPKCSC